MAELAGQVALVTGGGSGIGRACALALGRAGAAVALAGRRRGPLDETAGELAARGVETFVHPADLTLTSEVDALAAAVLERFGRLDVLVNSAGGNVRDRGLDVLSAADFDQVIALNLTAAFLITRALLPAMRKAGHGTVINISSMAGVRASLASGPAYPAAKAALNSLTESINLAERAHGIRACAICPGETDTPMLLGDAVPPSPDACAVMLQPEDVAAAVLLVASLPPRAAIELIIIRPTVLRDRAAERQTLK